MLCRVAWGEDEWAGWLAGQAGWAGGWPLASGLVRTKGEEKRVSLAVSVLRKGRDLSKRTEDTVCGLVVRRSKS